MMTQFGWESLAEGSSKAKLAMMYLALHGLVCILVWSDIQWSAPSSLKQPESETASYQMLRQLNLWSHLRPVAMADF